MWLISRREERITINVHQAKQNLINQQHVNHVAFSRSGSPNLKSSALNNKLIQTTQEFF